MSNNFDTAILIPTANRLQIIKRTIQNYSRSTNPPVLYIGDSSKKQDIEELESFIKFNQFNFVKLFHLPKHNVGNVLIYLSKQLDSKIAYVCFHGDDDFIFAENLELFKKGLDEDSSITSVQGYAITIEILYQNEKVHLGAFGDYWKKPSRLEAEVENRLINHSKNYFVAAFSLKRKQDLSPCVSGFTKFRFKESDLWQEYLESFATISLGKSIFLPIPYLIRGVHNARKLTVSGSEVNSLAYKDGKEVFVKQMASYLNLPKHEKFLFVEQLVENLLKKNSNKQKLRYFKKFIPMNIRFYLKILRFRKTIYSKMAHDYFQLVKHLD